MKNILCLCCAFVAFSTALYPQGGSGNSSPDIYRSEIRNAIRIHVEGGEYYYSDEAVILFIEEASSNFDIFDSKKSYSLYPDATMIWSQAEDGTHLSVNAMPLSCLYNGMTSIPIHFQCGYDGAYTFTFSEMESFDFPTEFWLEDLNLEADWFSVSRDSDTYSFDGLVSDSITNRFVIHFLDPTGFGEHAANIDLEKQIKIFASHSTIHIENNSDQAIKDIAIYNMLGQEVLKNNIPGQSSYDLYVLGQTGYYIVQVSTHSQIITEKVHISR